MKLSICMMVKNEGKYLEECLQGLQPLRDALESELIIVDTGSDDDSVEIAKRFTDKVYFHEWANNFSQMRNKTISYAKGEWVLIIDGDEVLQEPQPLIDFLRSKDRKKYGTVAISCRNVTNVELGVYSTLVGFRLFKNDGFFHYEGSVHNQPQFKGETMALPQTYLWHYGYLSNDAELMERKFKRTSAILLKELDENPTDVYYWTQLSVTYAMHNEYDKALKAAETAYSLLPEKRTANCMFVLLQLMLVYQHEEMHEQVIKVCRESMAIKEGYIDVYYYYAETQAMLKNYKEAVVYYEKYLQQLASYDQQAERDVSVIEYTLGNFEAAYYNLSQMLKSLQEYDKAIEYGEKVRLPKFMRDNMLNLVELYLYRGRYEAVRTYHDEILLDEMKDAYCEILARKMAERGEAVRLGVAKQFSSLQTPFGLLCRLTFESETMDGVSEDALSAAEQTELRHLPLYCSGILYYLLKHDGSLLTMTKQFQEIWLSRAFEYITKQHSDFCEMLDAYLLKFGSALKEQVKLRKTLTRCALLTRCKADERYCELFTQYLQDGQRYMESVYSQDVFSNEWVYDLKNDEEVFLLYMRQADATRLTDSAAYVRYLRLALQAFPAMKAGVEVLLNEMMEEKNLANKEFEEYKQEIKTQIKQLIEKGKTVDAQALLNDYKAIVPDDMEAVLLQSQLLLN